MIFKIKSDIAKLFKKKQKNPTQMNVKYMDVFFVYCIFPVKLYR